MKNFFKHFLAASLMCLSAFCAPAEGFALPDEGAYLRGVPRTEVILCGTPFGIKMKSDGVMAVKIAENSPAEAAGIRPGDVIKSVNGAAVETNEDISRAVAENPRCSTVSLERGGCEITLSLIPREEADGPKLGIFVRDSAAGVGTLTFINPHNNTFGGLGHSVSDPTTGGSVPLSSGEITRAEIFGAEKARPGAAGELCGEIIPSEELGEVVLNTDSGVYGTFNSDSEVLGRLYPVSFRHEVRPGPAVLLTTIDSSGPQEFSVEIEQADVSERTRSMIIRITDERLLEKTGGIVRGMSGSPIILDGRFAGAVTHVFLNDPTRGYAIFAENMLEISGSLPR